MVFQPVPAYEPQQVPMVPKISAPCSFANGNILFSKSALNFVQFEFVFWNSSSCSGVGNGSWPKSQEGQKQLIYINNISIR